MRVPSIKIHLAIARLEAVKRGAKYKYLAVLLNSGVSARSYDSGTDTWDLSERDAHKVEMLCSPYYEAIIKAWEARCEP